MSLIESKTPSFGLLLIVNDIGDPHDTLPKSVLWVKNDTMISKDPSGSRYKLWQFNCRTTGGGRSNHRGYGNGGQTASEIWKMFVVEDPTHAKWEKLWQKNERALKTHLNTSGLQNIQNTHWILSKTGEVNLTKFKQDKKAAIAKFLAKIR